jgi:hypothetical protein
MKKTIFISLVALMSMGAYAQESFSGVKSDFASTISKAYSEIIQPSTISKPGLFGVHKTGEKYFFEIPDSILTRELLLTNWLVKVPGGSPKYGGEITSMQTLSFEKAPNNKIFLRLVSLVTSVDSMTAISKAVRNANVDPIAMVFEVKVRGKDNNSSIIEVTDLFLKDNSFSAAGGEIKAMLGLTGLAAERTFIKSINAYPINVEIRTVRTYAASGAPIKMPAGLPPLPPTEAAKEAQAVTLEMSTSIMLMPKVPMQARRFDPRVGYFADYNIVYSDNQQRVEDKLFVVRYRLEPRPEDMEKYKRGELVEPREKIVYYVDPATPKQWRPYVIAGINDWNIAFEQAGFKNAIEGREWPENDSTMSLEDMRYKVVRYLPSDIANAYGPNIHDPRSGEILQSYVGWYHNIMQLLHDWYFVQASPVDPRARKMKFDEDLMGKLIQFAVAHEIGHTLGLRHNMGSSSLTPVEKLRDKEWVEEHGHTVSIMDYARFNYVAQPGDSISEKGIMPRIGQYDKWAIEWGYRYTGKNDEEDRKISAKWILDSLNANPKLWFGGEGRNFDARCQTEDLGDNSMKASEYGIRNLKIVMANLQEWTQEENDTYKNLFDMYRQVVNQYLRYSLHVTKNVASVYETQKTIEQVGDVYAPAPENVQREAVAFLNKEVFQTPYWLLDNKILNNISNPVRMGSVGTVQDRVLDQLLDDRVLNTILVSEQRNGKSSAYTLHEFITDVKKGIWQELRTHESIDIYRRNLQKNYVTKIFAAIKEAEFSTHLFAIFAGAVGEELLPITSNTEIPSYLSFHLEQLRTEILAAIPLAKDKATREHLKYLAVTIKQGLDNRFENSKLK